jgi:hypothetical protein
LETPWNSTIGLLSEVSVIAVDPASERKG